MQNSPDEMTWKRSDMSSCISSVAAYRGKVSRLRPTSRNTRRLEKRNRLQLSKNCAKAFQVSQCAVFQIYELESNEMNSAEEFGIYLNYVRKLGFEETPDYDFLRDLFAKVLKNNGDVEDHVYDWNLLNGRFLRSISPEISYYSLSNDFSVAR